MHNYLQNPRYQGLRKARPKTGSFWTSIQGRTPAERKFSWNSNFALAKTVAKNVSRQMLGPFELHFLRKRTSKISPNIFHSKFPTRLREENPRRSSANPSFWRPVLDFNEEVPVLQRRQPATEYPPPQKNYLRKKIPEELFSGWLRQFRVINYAKEFSENYFLGSYVNFA